MEPIHIPQLLKAPAKKEEIKFQEFIPNIETLTPVKGVIVVTHGGNYLEVFGQAETIITLTCDRCLQNYNYRLSLDTSELIWLEETPGIAEIAPSLERDFAQEDLSERLPMKGYFYPDSWLYEQLCLSMPLRQLCNKNCQVVSPNSSDCETIIDSRWASLAALKRNLSQ
jgi:uncharacterized protein